jgi:hypothetical protein
MKNIPSEDLSGNEFSLAKNCRMRKMFRAKKIPAKNIPSKETSSDDFFNVEYSVAKYFLNEESPTGNSPAKVGVNIYHRKWCDNNSIIETWNPRLISKSQNVQVFSIGHC